MKSDEYDVIIIGGGIGGIVCGCYLIKTGLKVLIVEKNKELGGYCQSITINGFTFNTCVRGFVGARSGGLFDKILLDLNLKDKIFILRSEVYDEIQFFGKSIALYNDPNRTINEIINTFPDEAAAIKKFFGLIAKENLTSEFFKYRNYSFQQLIDEFFREKELKFFLSVLRIDSGELPSKTSAIADLMLIRGNIFDGGYFPKGGMQSLINNFVEYFKVNGGDVLPESLVSKIKMNKLKAEGIVLSNGRFIKSKVVVSNADATLTYLHLLIDANINKKTLENIKSMVPSTSVFIMYLAVSMSLKKNLRYKCAAIWNFSKSIGDGIVCTLASVVDPELAPQNTESVTMYYGIPYKDEQYWERNKRRISDLFVQRFFRVFPEARNHILFNQVVTPIDLYYSTFNRGGASRGWSPSVKQINGEFPTYETPILNVFLVGHWVVSPSGNGGLTFAAQIGKKVAISIIKKWKKIIS